MTRAPRPGRIRFAIVALAAVLVGACASAPVTPAPGTGSPSAPATTPVTTTPATPSTSPTPAASAAPSTADEWMSVLAQSGVAVQASEADAAPLDPVAGQPILRLTRYQLTNMATEVADHGGILGSDIDVQDPMPDGAPPFSYLLAAWVTTDTSPAAGSIRDAMGEQDWEHAPTVVFPTMGLELFLAEAGLAARGPAANVMQSPARAAAFTPCSTVSNFVQDALSALFGALKVDPNQFGGDLPGTLFGFLARIWNAAVQLAQNIVQAALRELTRPIVDILRTGLATLAVISMLASYLKPITIAVDPAPQRTAFAVGNGPDVSGTFHARADISSVDWPPVLKDCAASVGFPLPELAKPGSPVEWDANGTAPGLITPTSPLATTLLTDRTSKLSYITGRESQDQADRGQPVSSLVWGNAVVERKEITEIKAAVEGFVLGQVPNAVAGVVNPILGPLVHNLVTRAAGALDAVFKVRGTGVLIVDHHKPPEPTPTPSPTASPSPTKRPTPRPTTPGPSPSGQPAPPCVDGCATSNGDPHMRTVDNHHYEFQAAGEYILLRSADGSIEIQSRQEPPDPAKPVTINTAVAARVNGHKVGVYVVGDALQLHVDGVVTTDTAPVDLGAGALVETHEHGYQVTFPDGSVLTLLSLGRWGINAIVKPSSALKTSGGLLGPVVPGGAELPALPDGTRLPRPTSVHDGFQQTYAQLAPAWLVTSATTLFDYDAGRDTSSYLIAGFPDEASLSLLNNLPPELQAKARQACAGVTDPDLLDQCAFDFAVTNAVSYLQLYGITASFNEVGPAALDQPPPPAPLPQGFFDIASGFIGIRGAALGPTGTLYVSLDLGSDQFQVKAVDPATGSELAHVDAQGGGEVKVAAGSVWVGEFAGAADCSVTRLDPGTLAVQATIAIPCDITSSQFTVLDDAIWYVDRTAKGSTVEQIRRIDPATNQPDTAIEVPFFNGYLGSSGTSIVYGAIGSGYYRLRTGETAFQAIGSADDLIVLPVEDGIWTQRDQTVVHFSSGDTPDRTVTIDGQMVGADTLALYVESSDPVDATSTLWRYPTDGSTPVQIGRAATINDQGQNQNVGYFDNDPLLVGTDAIVKLWVVQSDQAPIELIEQRVPLP
jgi:hypothetical protein